MDSRAASDAPADGVRLSFVIPAFNEAARLTESLARLKTYIATLRFPCEVIVIDDGSADATVAIAREWLATWPALRLLEEPHRGKGAAVRAGVLAAQGASIALADADFSMPVEEFSRFLGDDSPYDVAIGSREAPGAQRFDEPAYRHLMGRIFNRLVQVTLLPGIEDTQCGFKVLRRLVAIELCQRQTITGWGFDVELLAIARQRGYVIREIPIPWRYVAGSRIHPIRDTFSMVGDILTVRRNLRKGRYTRPLNAQPAATVELSG